MLMLEIYFVDSYKKSSGELKLNSEIKKKHYLGTVEKRGGKKEEEEEKRMRKEEKE